MLMQEVDALLCSFNDIFGVVFPSKSVRDGGAQEIDWLHHL